MSQHLLLAHCAEQLLARFACHAESVMITMHVLRFMGSQFCRSYRDIRVLMIRLATALHQQVHASSYVVEVVEDVRM